MGEVGLSEDPGSRPFRPTRVSEETTACLFEASGVTRGDGRRFSWSEFNGVDYLVAVRPPSGEEYLWRIELAFTGGEAWIIP